MPVPVNVPPAFRIIAHRGASGYAPENTWAAFELAAAIGCHEIELDAQLSSDGHVVICHDSTLERYGHGALHVEQLPWATLAALDMGSWFSPFQFAGEPMLRLVDLFAHDRPEVVYHVELKGRAAQLPRAVYELINTANLQDRCIITSFSADALHAMQQIAPDLRRGWLVEQVDEATMRHAADLQLFQLCPHAERVTAQQVAAAREVVSEVRAWGVHGNSATVAPLLQRLVAAGCNGVTLNWPDWARHR
ncbi:MAG TPA: glycerophosphodiester phosphodiesterase family protein [Roseiflexaceae bacterium]|nr:glycerophosphodiester phosphodiesterase family protein [Roseiflexaceae bacterium]